MSKTRKLYRITEARVNVVMRAINHLLPMSQRDILDERKRFFVGNQPLSPRQVVLFLNEYGNKSHRDVFHPYTETELNEDFPL